MRLIDADNLKIPNDAPYKASVKRVVAQQPTVEPVRGAWIVKEDENCFATWDYCSICGFSTGFAGSSHYINFCPNCGADMRGEKND